MNLFYYESKYKIEKISNIFLCLGGGGGGKGD